VLDAQQATADFNFVQWAVYILCCACCCGRPNVPDTYEDAVKALDAAVIKNQEVFDSDRAKVNEEDIEAANDQEEEAYDENATDSPPSIEEAEEASQEPIASPIEPPTAYMAISAMASSTSDEHSSQMDHATSNPPPYWESSHGTDLMG
jgi:hypothetical protein